MLRIGFVPLVVALAVCGSGCGRRAVSSQAIVDARKPQALTFKAPYPVMRVSGVTIRVKCLLKGSATFTCDNWTPIVMTGTVAVVEYHDWFQPTLVLNYAPTDVQGGDLTVECEFQ